MARRDEEQYDERDVQIAAASASGGMAGAVARTAGSIWLISLAFFFVALAVGTYAVRLQFQRDIEQSTSSAGVQEADAYGNALAAWNERMEQNYYVYPRPNEMPSVPDSQQTLVELRSQNSELRTLLTRRPPPVTGPRPGGGGTRANPREPRRERVP